MEAATQREIRIGVIGADTKTSWAKASHVPAINDLQGLRLAAVATRNEQSAREAAKAFGADRWYSDPFAMIRDDRIDVVTVAVAVPAHRELVLAALEAGKAVYCEAPLGRSVTEAEEMAKAARSLHTAIGLQGRHNPAVRRAAELVSSGRIGRPLNASITSSTVAFGPEMPAAQEYYIKLSSGANLLTIAGGHTLDLVEAVLGQIVEVDARTEIRWPTVTLIETGAKSVRETADYVGIVGRTALGAAFTAEIEAGMPAENVRFSFDVRGSDGWLSLTSTHPGGVQIGDLKLRSTVPFAEPDAPAVSDTIMETAINVGEVYAQLARDMTEGTERTPGFREALHNSRLIEAVRRSADLGVRQKVPKPDA
ncbi:Predicted dehydrogenase [Bradyrhizobium brasilense]|uniref:Predicted dehydrogenase n=1 Tax=Bradyrhizobium brasilense TaxID=1419277 RepID=A0A1G6N7C3_9BRAD|nr:Gfo/Idh/MocA family oxidoreductase [Bradyrhizobium brasilense]SDC63719.1 Predicted dehydrogenase [Bradyrhizobium brasilense]